MSDRKPPSNRDALLACSNCGASLSRDSEVCSYCKTRYDRDLREFQFKTRVSADEERHCPRCPDTLLSSIDLNLDGPFHIERCETCHGMFFDAGELQMLIDYWSRNVFLSDLARLQELGSLITTWEKVAYLKCPICLQLMARRNFGKSSRVVTDTCIKHGIWLDGGELSTLLKWAKAGGGMEPCRLDAERKRLREVRERFEKERRKNNLSWRTKRS